MHIFQVLESSTNSAVPRNQTWRRNLYEPLLELGHEVTLFSSENGRKAMQKKNAKLRTGFGEELLDGFKKAIAAKPIDLFFAYLMDGMIDPEFLAEIHTFGVPMVNFSCNNIHQFDLVDGLSPFFDLNLYAEKEAGIKFERLRTSGLWWPMASNPKYFYPMNLPRDVDVSFVGANYALRADYIRFLLENHIDVQVFGPNWLLDPNQSWKTPIREHYYQIRKFLAIEPGERKAEEIRQEYYLKHRALNQQYLPYLHLPICDDELIALYSRSKISLGFLEVFEDHDPGKPVHRHLHLREFEAPMCGALYCTGYSEELAEMFEPEKEILTYHSKEELLDKIRYYAIHPRIGEKIRQAGRKRALAEHTYQQRYQTLFKVMRLGIHAKS